MTVTLQLAEGAKQTAVNQTVHRLAATSLNLSAVELRNATLRSETALVASPISNLRPLIREWGNKEPNQTKTQ